jgi:hypothetical protein
MSISIFREGYTNPANDFVALNFATSVVIKQIIETDIVLKKELEATSTEGFLNISKLPSGLYTITFKSDLRIWTKKGSKNNQEFIVSYYFKKHP